MKSIILILLLLYSFQTRSETLEGIAKSISGDFLYREVHKITRDQNNQTTLIETNYYKKDGTVFASLTSDFKNNKYVPDSVFVDHRFEEKIITTVSNGKVQFKFFKKNDSIKNKDLKLDELMVAGQGFDNYLQEYIVNNANKSSIVHFVVIPQADYFKFKISESNIQDKYEKVITIKPESFLIRIVVDEIKLIYSQTSKILKRYQGISNINSDKNESQVVDIEYKLLQGES